ncbi:hypothetical protein C4D60_Mb05t19490 [Musa balbisiana]|uniref:Uncharacterized protein n=1 Tax=Musa balbisiana TaxID=52838 RepID=A0A4S8JXC0_MUSBA|nr:hypothetical protein C4D60_Mb05t19490 [Musa balbisiana]
MPPTARTASCLLPPRKAGPAVCDRSHDVESPYYQPLNPCISGMRSQRWISIESQTPHNIANANNPKFVAGRKSYSLIDFLTSSSMGWVIIRDTALVVETARSMTTQLRWDVRLIELDRSSDEKLLFLLTLIINGTLTFEVL